MQTALTGLGRYLSVGHSEVTKEDRLRTYFMYLRFQSQMVWPRAAPFRYQEQPLVPPQFAHLWQLPLRTISDPQVTQSGASPTS